MPVADAQTESRYRAAYDALRRTTGYTIASLILDGVEDHDPDWTFRRKFISQAERQVLENNFALIVASALSLAEKEAQKAGVNTDSWRDA